MDKCVIDGWETFKGLTPYIIAIVVVLIWHYQKGKEVVANEAKDIIKSLNSYKNMNIESINEIEKVTNLNDFYKTEDAMNRRLLIKNLSNSFDFFLSIRPDKNLKKDIDLLVKLDEEFRKYVYNYIDENKKDINSFSKLFDYIIDIEDLVDSIKIKLAKYSVYKIISKSV